MIFNIKIRFILTVFLAMLVCSSNYGQMKKIVEKDGFGIYFLFYSEGNGVENNGVVIYLENKNDYPIRYTFQLVFRTEIGEKTQEVEGSLKAGERKTGSNEGLYFIPFKDKRSIIEVGVKKIRVDQTIK
jgi:hypothetical protein